MPPTPPPHLPARVSPQEARANSFVQSVFASTKHDTLRALISQLHARGALHVLANLEFEGTLAEELHMALLSHARCVHLTKAASHLSLPPCYRHHLVVLTRPPLPPHLQVLLGPAPHPHRLRSRLRDAHPRGRVRARR